MNHRPLYVRRKCNQIIMGKDVGFCIVSKMKGEMQSLNLIALYNVVLGMVYFGGGD